MKGDYSRDTFDPTKHFTRVLMQQGRVQLDADWNEQGAILLHYLQTLAADLIGSYGGPVDQLGFEIRPVSPGDDQTKLTDLSIGFGRYYVDGILCENYDQSPHVIHAPKPGEVEVATRDSSGAVRSKTGSHFQTTYRDQADYPPDPLREDPKKDFELPLFVYLDVWERHITAFEDDDIREVALGGPDTAARAKVVWQVRIKAVGDDTEEIRIEVPNLSCKEFEKNEAWIKFKKTLQPENRGMLRARAYVPQDSGDVCIVSPESRYRGAENQLYRVEIHKGGTGHDGPTFKWSRENGSTVYPIQSLSGNTVTLESLGRDARFGLEVGDWVEVVDDDYTLLGKAESLLRVEAIDPIEMMVTLNDAPQSAVGQNQKRHPLLRRWDQQEGDSKTGGLTLTDGAAHVIERTKNNSHWLNLEDGVQVQFEPEANYRRGDFWLIPARTATGDVEWPGLPDNPVPMPPKGVEHHYAPLAVVFRKDDDDPHFEVIDLRHKIEPLSKCVCPRIEVVRLQTTGGGNEITFAARVGSTDPNLTYDWQETHIGGTVTTANPQPNRFVVTPTNPVTKITAKVKVGKLPPGCPDSASATWEKAPQ
jgi:hypothetical protein